VNTNQSGHNLRRYHNLYQNQIPDQQYRVWVVEITFIVLRKGYAYLAVILDACSSRLNGFQISMSRTATPHDNAQAESFMAILKKRGLFVQL
jgi:putative transposase